jgi:hypothetical protein
MRPRYTGERSASRGGLPRPDVGVRGEDAAITRVRMEVPKQLGPAGPRELVPARS